MNALRNLLLAIGLVSCSTGLALADHVPDVFQIIFPISDSLVIRSDRIGAGTYDGLGATWAVNDYDASIVFDNAYVYTVTKPYLILEWHDVDQTMPVSVSITSNTGARYSIVPKIELVSGGAQDFSLSQYNLAGSTYFGHHIPVADLFSLQIILEDPTIFYDLTVTMNWGPGVPNEATSWDQVKSLYR